MSIGEIPDAIRAAMADRAPELPAIRPPDGIEMRYLAGVTSYDTNVGWMTNSWSGWGGWQGWGRCPPALIMSTAAFRCRVVILDNLAKARPYLRDKDTKKEHTGEFAQKLAMPMGNEDPAMSLKRWVTVNVSSMLEQGDAHIWKSEEKYLTRFARNGSAIRRAYIPLPVNAVEPTPGTTFWRLDHWTYIDPVTGAVVDIPPEEMARIEYLWNPKDYFRGIGPMESCKLAVETDYWYALQARNRQMKGGLPALLLMNQRAGTNDQELKAFLAEFRRQMADERGGVAGLGSDWKIERLSMTAQEADEVNARRYMVEEVARAHGIPLIDLGVYTSTGFGREGMDILNRMRHTATIQPLSERFADGVTQQIVEEVEPGLEFAFDWSKVRAAQDDMGEMIGYAERLFAMGVPMDEAARITNLALEDYTGKALGFLQGSLLTMDEILLRLDAAKNPPPPPPQLAPFTGPGGQPPPDPSSVEPPPTGGKGTNPDVAGTPPVDGGGKKSAASADGEDQTDAEKKKAADEKKASRREARVLRAVGRARIPAAMTLSARELDRLEARARRVRMSPAAFDRLIALASADEVDSSIKFQNRVDPYAVKIRQIFDRGVNRGFKDANDKLWQLQKTRKKIRLDPGEKPPANQFVYSDSQGSYYFEPVPPETVADIVSSIDVGFIANEIVDVQGDAFDEGIDSMKEELSTLGYIGEGATIAAVLLAGVDSRRALYLQQRRAIIEQALQKIRNRVNALLDDAFAYGEDIGLISDRLMKDAKKEETGGEREVREDSEEAADRHHEEREAERERIVQEAVTAAEEAATPAEMSLSAVELQEGIEAATQGAVEGEPIDTPIPVTGEVTPAETPPTGVPVPVAPAEPIEPEVRVTDVYDAPGKGELWGDEEAYDAANAGRAALAAEQVANVDPDAEAGPGLWWRWITMDDNKVRDAHDEIFGKVVQVGETFIDGADLKFPGDPDCDDLSLTMNCRCWTEVLSPDELATEAEVG